MFTTLSIGLLLSLSLGQSSESRRLCENVNRTEGLYLAKLRNGVPDSTAFFIAKKLVRWNLEDVARARQVILFHPELGRDYERGIDYQFGCCLFGKLRAVTLKKICSDLAYLFQEVHGTNSSVIPKGVISNVRFAHNLLDEIEQKASMWRKNRLRKVNDTLVRCKGKISDEMHLYPDELHPQMFRLLMKNSSTSAMEQFRARMNQLQQESENFLFEESSFNTLFAILEVNSNRKTITKICVDPGIAYVNPNPRLYLK